jgi:uncharacterized protein YcbK (DUF882 family)
MTALEFLQRVLQLAVVVPFSVTSWLRSPARNRAVGGVPTSRHLDGAAVDVVLDRPEDREVLRRFANRLGLQVLDEGDHLHLEPR